MAKRKNEIIEVSQIEDNSMVSSYYGNFHEETDKLYDSISGILPVNIDLQNQLSKRVAFDRLTDNVKLDNAIAKIDIESEIKDFLMPYSSIQTRKMYFTAICKYRKFCIDNGIELLKTTTKIADFYVAFLKDEKLSSRSIQAYIKGLSVFFQYLHLEHFDVIKINPFHRRKLPNIQDRFEKDKVSGKDFKVLCDDLKRINRPDLLYLVRFLYKYGKRIGIFRNMKINEDGTWTSISKGIKDKGKVSKLEYKQIIESGVFNLTLETVSSKIRRITARLYKAGKISCQFSVHDLRRARMYEDFKNEKGAISFIKTSKRYHKNPNTSVQYFESIMD